ncbi:protein-disulfide reductase DsbD [Hydrogenimonas thermophila]|uniref:Thiol:disulfide interchange protein DsbD n=1 Tax=Hydrogenimonas thermophila TaxID=223786 RepID=A0A1I5SQL5_9BACT|nr:protein-disulfide reductase DsbD [Hydrogenimonas thermophila]SFP72921.1 Thiol:disulfide interchange protein DsbD [Hydrogenimonas thermophila]
MRRIMISILFAISLYAGFLSVDDAFHPAVTLKDNKVFVQINMADHIHLTKDALKFDVKPVGEVELGKYTLPAAEKDEFGDEIYTKEFKVKIPLILKSQNSKDVTFVLTYQGCSDRGVCYPPVTKEYNFTLSTPAVSEEKGQKSESNFLSEEESIASTLKSKSFGIVLLTFFGFGLLLALTPCIFPMIPILSSIIVAQGEGMTARRGFWLSLVYVLSMAFTYTLAGVLAGLFGANIQAALQNPWVISLFSLLFVALAFSMFGFYEIGLPASIQSRLSKTSDEAGKKGGIVGVAIMGFLSALIVGPCVAPPLAGALIYIGQTGDALLGGAALFVMSLGMGAPLVLIGMGAGRFMPKPGGWMTTVSKIFGVVMLGVAIWMLSRIIPETLTMGLWSILFIISSVYMGAFEPLGSERSWNALLKGVGLLFFIYGLFLFFGTFTGAKNPIDPLQVIKERSYGNVELTRALQFETVKSLDDLLVKIKNSNKPVMVDFRADWCVSCKELEDSTFKDKKVIDALNGYNLYQVDVTQNSVEQKRMMKYFGIFGPPAILFFKNGEEIKHKRVSGYKSPSEFLEIISL